jgi:iron(III) transport system permease protein
MLRIRLRSGTLVRFCALVVTSSLMLLPLGFLFYTSFRTDAPGAPHAIFTLHNWQVLFDAQHRVAILNTMQIALYATVFTILIGGVLAWLIARTNVPMRRPLSLLLVLPILLSPLLTTLAWTVMASPRAGLINVAYHHFVPGFKPLFDIYSLAGIVLVMVLHFVPFAYLVMLTALQAIDASFEDASRVAGARMLTTLRRITLPVVTPAILSASLLVFALASEQLAVPTLLGPQAKLPTLQYQIYVAMVDSPTDPSFAAAAGCFLLLITIVGIFLYGRALGVARRFVTVSGKVSAPRRLRLGAWRWPALAICLLYLLLAVGAPYGALVLGSLMKYVTPMITPDLFTLRNYELLINSPPTIRAMENTLIYGLGAATLAVAFSALLSYLTTRSSSLLTRLIEQVANLPLAVPAISLGLGLLWAYLFLPIAIYGTAWVLILAYLTRFSPQGLRSLSSSLVQVDPELELAARVSGASVMRAVRDILAPLLRPALMAAWILLFVQMTLEISMTILLYTPKTATAAITIWFAYFGGNSVLAYTLAVVLASFSFVVVLIGQRFFGLLSHVG